MRSFEEYYKLAEQGLEKFMHFEDCPQKTIYEAMKYSVDAGGKRIRPVLTLAAAELCGGKAEDALPFACAIEMVHTFSLIHDDLPCMDDDDMRRGRPTSHKVYGEGMAVLAGDALIIKAFETAVSANVPADRIVKAVGYLSKLSGCKGMIGGQVVDLESENSEISAETLEFLHVNKTSALIQCALLLGGASAGADEKTMSALFEYGLCLGLAFQVQDDILDVCGDSEMLGKQVGSDAEKGKSTFVTMYGLEKSRQMVADYTCRAKTALSDFEGNEFFCQLADSMANRKK